MVMIVHALLDEVAPGLEVVVGDGICRTIDAKAVLERCLLYTSDAADDTPCVDLGGRRII